MVKNRITSDNILLKNFLEELGLGFHDDCEEQQIIKDESNYHVVDGEEGGWGYVKYYSVITGKLLAIIMYSGGDIHETYFTEEGLIDLQKPILQTVLKKLTAFKTHTEEEIMEEVNLTMRAIGVIG